MHSQPFLKYLLPVLVISVALLVVKLTRDNPQPAAVASSISVAQRLQAGQLRLVRVGSFNQPVYVAAAPGLSSQLFIIERTGKIIVVDRGRKSTFLNLTDLVESAYAEQGLLSVAFPPDFQSTRNFYVYFTNKEGSIEIDQLQANKSFTQGIKSSRRKVIVIPHPVNLNHNGGQLLFHGHDLLLGTGDGGSGGDPPDNAQNKNVLLGKIIRITPKASGGYTIPDSNPFVGVHGHDAIYAYGLRNPWRFTIHNNHLIIGDVGQEAWEEIDYLPFSKASGANFGWSRFEGFSTYNATRTANHAIKPILVYSHEQGCAVIGGYVVGSKGPAGLQGRYLYSDQCNGQIRSLRLASGHAIDDHPTGLRLSNPSSFGTANGSIYISSLNGGVYRIR